jgi:hypothetical protein
VVTRAATGLALALVAGPAVAVPPRVSVHLEPSRPYVHQQLVLEVRLVHPIAARPRWEAPSFEGFWSERLSSVGWASEGPARERVTAFRRALFPARAGRLRVPPSRIRYGEGDDERTLDVPGAEVVVRPVPAAGRPAGWSGAVGDVAVDLYLSRPELALGRSTRLVVDFYGTANLWDVPPPDLETALAPDVEVFADRPASSTGERNGRLTMRRTFRFDLVPRSTGDFAVPALALAFFDPAAGRYREARSETLLLRALAPGVSPRRRRASASAPAPSLPVPLLAVALVALAIGAGVALALTRWWRAALRSVLGPPGPSPRLAFERACAAVGTDAFPARLADAVRAGVHARHRLDSAALTSEEIARRLRDPTPGALLRRLDRIRFAAGGENPEALLADVRAYLEL